MALRLAATRIELPSERSAFLSSLSDKPATQRTYRQGLDAFLTWCENSMVHPLTVTRSQAKLWLEHLKTRHLAPATISRLASSAGAWFTWLERRHKWIKNPFHRLKLDTTTTAKTLHCPSAQEVDLLLKTLPAADAAAIFFLANGGFRAGGLSALEIKGTRWSTLTKGKNLSGDLFPGATQWIGRAGLDPKKPFAFRTGPGWSVRVKDLTKRLAGPGILKVAYSAHCFRHFFAVTEYERDKNLERVQSLLGHRDRATTERYLRTLGIG